LGLEAWAFRLAAEVAAEREPGDAARAEGLFREAMKRAEQLGARPLSARCHLGLGTLFRRIGRAQDARAHLVAASQLFNEMQMRLWSERVQTSLSTLPD